MGTIVDTSKMRINQQTEIHGEKVILVPYKSCHVSKYHGWMQDAELQQLTASEPLSLEQEYEMQQSWSQDQDKCTFIVVHREDFMKTAQAIEDEIACMAGDVNLFYNDADDRNSAEVEVMIAEVKYRGKGLGKEALLAMLKYGKDKLGIERYTAKIGMQNETSLKMFKKLKFSEVSRSEVFQEVTLELLRSNFDTVIEDITQHIEIKENTKR